MKRRDFVSNIALSGVLGTAATKSGLAHAQETQITGTGTADQPPNSLMTTPLVLMAPRQDAITAIWGVSEQCKGRLEWEDNNGAQGIAAVDEFGMVPQGTQVLQIHLRGLQPGKEYRVRGISTSVATATTQTTEWKTFRTLDATADQTRFVVWNDTHINNPTIQKLDEVTPAGDFLLWNGDTCNDWTKEELLIPTILHAGQRDISKGRPLLLVWGNHDVRGQWAYQLPQMVATPSGRPFYAFRSGPVAVICLHTGEDKPDNHPSFKGRVAFDALRHEQTEWLKETIAKPEFKHAPYRMVFCHIPLRWTTERIPDYDAGGYDYFSHRSRAAWNDSLVAWKTQVVISGHTHQHAWIPPNDKFPYGQLTGGGPAPQQATWLEATANRQSLTLRTRQLDNNELHTVSFEPLS